MGLANDAANLEMGLANDAARLRTASVRQDQRKCLWTASVRQDARRARTMAEQRLDSILKTSQANCPGLDDDSPPLILSGCLRRFLYRRKASVLCTLARREFLETNRQGARTNPRCQPWKE